MTHADLVTLPSRKQGAYDTDDEIEFIDRLGRGVWSDGIHAMTGRAALLKGYIAGAERRTVWGRISADAAIAHARKALREESLQGEAGEWTALTPEQTAVVRKVLGAPAC